jgi:hypothetical protein
VLFNDGSKGVFWYRLDTIVKILKRASWLAINASGLQLYDASLNASTNASNAGFDAGDIRFELGKLSSGRSVGHTASSSASVLPQWRSRSFRVSLAMVAVSNE